MKLRFRLCQDLPGPLPMHCQLPAGYALDVCSDRDVCQHCGGRLRRVRTSTQFPIGLMLGCPRVRLIHRQCVLCSRADAFEDYHQLVPPRGNYAYDLIAEVGLVRFSDHRQDAEIQSDLQQRWGLSLPVSSIGWLGHSFLDGLAAVHQAHAATLRRRLAEDGGYAMHVDGTCESGTDVLFAAMAEPRGWTLDAARMTTENAAEIGKMMRSCADRFGEPLAVVRDLSTNIQKAKQAAIPKALDLICHYHFLENVGKQLCKQPHTKLTNALRRLKVRAALKSLRKDLVRWSRTRTRFSRTQIDRLLSHPKDIANFDAVPLRRCVAYMLLRWLDDYTVDLRGEYFPFDLPTLAFYRRGVELGKFVSTIVALPDFPRKELSILKTMARHLALLRDDAEAVAAAERTEKAAALFEELRKVLRLSTRSQSPLLRGRVPSQAVGRKAAEQIHKGLEAWRDCLRNRHTDERDEHRRADQATVLKYLQKYEHQLVGHVIELEGREPFVVCRTNNPIEHRFGSTKRAVRRKVGAKKLTRQIQAMRPEALLVCNLADPEYVNLVFGGRIENLPSEFAKHWRPAHAIRKQRQAPTTDHPLPATKKQIRDPNLLQKMKKAIKTIMETISGRPHAV